MSVSRRTMHFREKRASELELIARVIGKICKGSNTSHPIYNAANQLRDPNYLPVLKDGSTNPDCWGYEIENFIIPVETTKHIKPEGITNVELILNMKIIANYKEWETLSDPFYDLNFSVVIRGIGENTCYTGFHIDRHFENATSTEPHPIYHLQYTQNPQDDPLFMWGNTMYLDTPRIMHYPMDFILGFGFLTSNYAPTMFYKLLDDGTFTNLYKEYQEKIWKPFSHSLANHWPYEKGDIVWEPTSLLCPYMI